MGWFSKRANSKAASDSNWDMLDHTGPLWEVSSPRTFSSFLRALVGLAPSDAMLYLEGGGSPPDELRAYLEDHCAKDEPIIPMGTLWPKPKYYHLSATPENLKQLADIAEHCAEPQLAVHCHLYVGRKLLLQWYDAFADPMFVSQDIPEDTIKAFCQTLDIRYSVKKQ